jgi:ribose-phosphate pyrophosphokinase
MKTLNLVYLEESDIKYKVSNMPDGQKDIVLVDMKKELLYSDYHPQVGVSIREWKYPKIEIKSRFNNFKDLEIILCATKALRGLGVKEIHLYIPYILGARSDRQFVEGGTSYLRDVVAPILNAQGFDSITCIDVHSDVASACINNLKVIDNIDLVKYFLSLEQSKDYNGTTKNLKQVLDNIILVSPDSGSLKKIYKVADAIGYKGDIITCSKSRDTDGKLTKTVVPLDKWEDKDYIIIDDICDGGRTFINIAKEIKAKNHKFGFKPNKIYLIITHTILSNSVGELQQYIDGIYCTNSYKDFDLKPYITQLNVF